MFIRLNRGSVTNIFNLDNVTNVYITSTMVSLEFVDKDQHFAFYKKQDPKEYEQLKSFFGSRLNAHTINA